jgi:hypothetical protein
MAAITQYLDIVFPETLSLDDLVISQAACVACPGLARLHRATIGPARPGAPNSRPVEGRRGIIGHVAPAELVPGPYDSVYRLVEAG